MELSWNEQSQQFHEEMMLKMIIIRCVGWMQRSRQRTPGRCVPHVKRDDWGAEETEPEQPAGVYM